MQDLDIDKILKVVESDKIGTNTASIMEMLKSANQFMSQIEQLMNKAEKMGIKPLLVRGAGKQLKIDAETPLRSETAVNPVTESHRAIFNHLNTLSENDLQKMFGGNEDEAGNDQTPAD